jgi:RNA polymerase sigma-70 factor (ECF subfamily)
MSVAAFNVGNEPVAREFEELFNEHYPLVYRTAYSVSGNVQDAEDVVQTVFLRLLRRRAPVRFRENPKGYLYRAAINVSLNTIRSQRRHVLTGDEERLDRPVEEATAEPDLLQSLLPGALAQLSPRSVEMLILRYQHHYREAQIGNLLGTSRGVVAVTLFRARVRLKKLLQASSGGKS